MVVLPLLFLLGSLFPCGHGDMHSSVERLKIAALSLEAPLQCGKWDCNCTFYQQRGCCCAATDMFSLEEQTFHKIKDLWQSIAKLKYGIHALAEYRQIAFKATMDANMEENCFGPFNTFVTVPYSTVTLNDGNGFNPSLGVFTAPCDGVFVFSLTVYSSVTESEHLYHKVQLMRNTEMMVAVWENNREDFEDNGHQVVVMEMQRGDQAYVQLMNGRKLCGAVEHNIFTGYILYPNTYNYDYGYESEDY